MRPRHVECSTRRGRFFYFYSVLFRNAVVSDDVRSLFQNILLVSCLPWVIVVDHIRHTVFISTVRHYADMSFFDRHDLSEPFRALYAQYAAKISEAVQTTKNASEFLLKRFVQVGDYLFSRAVSSELSSAQVSLTSVFGMGTGGTSPSSTPTDLTGSVYHNWSTLSSVS